MKTKKKRNKQNNPHRRSQRATDALLRYNHVSILAIEGYEGMVGVNMATGRVVHIGNELGSALQNKPLPWRVFLAAFCRGQDGLEYMQHVDIVAKARYKQERLGKEVERRSADLEASCNPNHYIRQGWVASPVGKETDEELAAKLFERMGAWESWREHEARA